MTKFLQILLIVIAVQWFETNGIPLFQGISFQKGFEINLKPLPRKPIAFIKEKWSPFGVFGKKHAIQKRSIGGTMIPVDPATSVTPIYLVPEPRPAAPVFEHVNEENFQTSPIKVLPPQTSSTLTPMDISSSPIPPLLSSPIPSQPIISFGALTDSSPPPIPVHVMITPPPKPVLSEVPLPSIIPNNPPVPIEVATPSISSNMVIPPSGLLTDITRSQPVREYMDSVQPISPSIVEEQKVAPPLETNSIKPEAPRNDIVINDNSFIRGSKLALYFGNIFLQLMSQFLTNARATFDQITNPPPVYT